MNPEQKTTEPTEQVASDNVTTDSSNGQEAPRSYKLVFIVGGIVIFGLLLLNGFLFYQFMNIDEGRDVVVVKKTDVVIDNEDPKIEEEYEEESPIKEDDPEPIVIEDKIYTASSFSLRYPGDWVLEERITPDMSIIDVRSPSSGSSFAEFSVMFDTMAPMGFEMYNDCGEGDIVESKVNTLLYTKALDPEITNEKSMLVCESDDGGTTWGLVQFPDAVFFITQSNDEPYTEELDKMLQYVEML